MNETERIHKMVEAGTITGAEAERLLSVLNEIDEAEGRLDASAEAMEAEAQRVAEPSSAPAASASDANEVAAPTQPEPTSARPEPAADATDAAPEGTRWVHVSLLAGDVTLRADPDVQEVVLKGDADGVQIERTADGYAVRHQLAGRNGSWVDRLLNRIRSGQLEVRVPQGYGVDLDITAGDVDIEDIPYLRGHLTSGDLDARGLHGIDFRTAAGDLDLEMTLTEGEHRLRATAGDVNVRLGAGSSVTVEGSVSIGSASVHAAGSESEHRGLGQHFAATVGGGAARLALQVTTGDVDVEVDDER